MPLTTVLQNQEPNDYSTKSSVTDDDGDISEKKQAIASNLTDVDVPLFNVSTDLAVLPVCDRTQCLSRTTFIPSIHPRRLRARQLLDDHHPDDGNILGAFSLSPRKP